MPDKLTPEQERFLVEFGDIFIRYCGELDASPDQAAIDFGEYLYASRNSQGLSRSELSNKTGISEAKIYAIEQGWIPSKEIHEQNLYVLAQALSEDIEIFDLLLERNNGYEALVDAEVTSPPQAPEGEREPLLQLGWVRKIWTQWRMFRSVEDTTKRQTDDTRAPFAKQSHSVGESPSPAQPTILPQLRERFPHWFSERLAFNLIAAIVVVALSMGVFIIAPRLPGLGRLAPGPTPAGSIEDPGVFALEQVNKSFLLEDFEKGFLAGWLAAKQQFGAREVATRVQLSSDSAVGEGALQCDFDLDLIPDLEDPKATCYFSDLPIADWTEYDALLFQAKSLVDPEVNMRVYISLATRNDSCWNELGVFQSLNPEYQTYIFNLDAPLYATCENLEDYNQMLLGKEFVRRLHLIFIGDQRVSGSVLVDDIWLAKLKS